MEQIPLRFADPDKTEQKYLNANPNDCGGGVDDRRDAGSDGGRNYAGYDKRNWSESFAVAAVDVDADEIRRTDGRDCDSSSR